MVYMLKEGDFWPSEMRRAHFQLVKHKALRGPGLSIHLEGLEIPEIMEVLDEGDEHILCDRNLGEGQSQKSGVGGLRGAGRDG